jgi:hypothetical protein
VIESCENQGLISKTLPPCIGWIKEVLERSSEEVPRFIRRAVEVKNDRQLQRHLLLCGAEQVPDRRMYPTTYVRQNSNRFGRTIDPITDVGERVRPSVVYTSLNTSGFQPGRSGNPGGLSRGHAGARADQSREPPIVQPKFAISTDFHGVDASRDPSEGKASYLKRVWRAGESNRSLFAALR